jgi:6-pyruvoyl-tetrahydropterin synthase
MAFTLSLRRAFVADHFHDLPGFQEERHGHNWEVEAAVELAREADEPAFAEALDAWVTTIDYRLLNELPPLAGRNPTAEALAELAFFSLQGAALKPQWVKIREKANYWALCRAPLSEEGNP